MSESIEVQAMPAGLGESGVRLWEAVTTVWELEEHERVLLKELCRSADSLDRLQELVAEQGEVVPDRFGQDRASPAMVEARQLRLVMARLSAALRLPDGEEGDESKGRRPQRRVGVRGVHKLGVVS